MTNYSSSSAVINAAFFTKIFQKVDEMNNELKRLSEKVERLERKVNKCAGIREISLCDNADLGELLAKLNIDVDGNLDLIPDYHSIEYPAFAYDESLKTSNGYRHEQLLYLQDALELDKCPLFDVHDVANNIKDFEVSLAGTELIGTTDFVISVDKEIASPRETHVIIRLVKHFSLMDTTEVEMELVAAQGISYYAIVAVLTDLNDYWKIFWFEKSNSGEDRDTKRRRLEEKSRPTFKAVKYRQT